MIHLIPRILLWSPIFSIGHIAHGAGIKSVGYAGDSEIKAKSIMSWLKNSSCPRGSESAFNKNWVENFSETAPGFIPGNTRTRDLKVGDINQSATQLELIDVHARYAEENTLLHLASQKGEVGLIEKLIAGGADIHAKNRKGKTPLHLAVNHRHEGAVELLIAKGAEVNAKDFNGKTPLHITVWNGQIGIIKLLIVKGADVNAIDGYKNTPLCLARKDENIAIIEILIANGARSGNPPIISRSQE